METPEPGLELPSPCSRCGYLTGVLNTIPPRNPPIDLIRSHYLPSPTERTAIQADISSSETAIQTLEAEISKLQAAMSLIESRLANIRKYADSNQALLSPWRRLPEDVLREIFYHICDKPINVLSGSDTFWTLQQVCTRWRNVVLNTPLLWSDIAAIPDGLDVQTLTGQSVVMERTDMFVRLSKSVPLSVISLVNNVAGCDISPGIPAYWTHDSTWSKELSLKRYRNVTGYRIFEGAPALEHVIFEGCILPDVSEFTWAAIKYLSLSRCLIGSLTESYDIGPLFSALHNLEELQWKENFVHIKPILTTVTLPSLSKASVELSSELLQAMSMLRVPHLTVLQIEEDEDTPLSIHSNDLEPLLSMIQMSGCKIKTLGLAMESPAVMLQVLKEVTTQDIKELFLTINPDTEDSEDLLLSLERKAATVNSEASVLLPALKELTVHNSFFEYDSDTMDIYVRCVKRIACTRSRAYTRRAVSKLSLVPLSSITCYLEVPVDQVEEYEDEVEEVEDFAREWGVDVNFILQGRQEGTDGGDSPSDSGDLGTPVILL